MSWGIFTRLGATVAVGLVLAGCDSIPRESLNNYTSAFNQARVAGESLVNDYAAAKMESDRRDLAQSKPAAALPALEIPIVYTPPLMGGEVKSAHQVRLQAWETIAAYNTALAALSGGESVATVKSSTERFGKAALKIAELAGAAIPGADALIGAAKELAALAEQARLSGEFKKALTNGAPKVQKMISILIDDTVDHYRLRAALANEDLIDIPLADKVKRERVKASITELKKSMDAFVLLARKCEESLEALKDSAERPMNFELQAEQLFSLVTTLKGHWSAYQAARTESAQVTSAKGK